MKTSLLIILVSTLFFSPNSVFSQGDSHGPSFVCPPCGDGSCDTQVYSEAGTCPHCGMILINKEQVKNVAIFIHNGVEILDFSGPGEVFAATHTDKGAFNVYTVSLSTEPIVSQGFVKIIPEYALEDAPAPDIIVLPGGNTGAVSSNSKLLDWIRAVEPDLEVALSVCTGAFILQQAGLLDGLKATTWHGAIDRLKESATKTEILENTRWVDNGKIITTAGVSAGIDGALHVVSKIFGIEAAQATARYMEYDKWKPGEGLTVSNP